jgi:phenylpyruvate tautomerase PptA (4-oxalocrotonate tautomerase family)
MPHVTVQALEAQLAGQESELVGTLTDAVVSVYGEWARDHVVVQLVGFPVGRWAVGGVARDDPAPAVTLAMRESALTRPDGPQTAARLAATMTDAVAVTLGERHRAEIVVDLVGTSDDRTAVGGRLVSNTPEP